MSIKQDIDKSYVIVSSFDIIKCMKNHKNNEKIYQECKEIFLNNDIEDNCFKLSSFHPVVLLLKKEKEEKYYVDASILKESLAISISENNHYMQKKITSYFRKYMDNERKGISNVELITEIVSDEETINFIKKYSDFETYEQEIISKSYIKMQKQIRLLKEKQIKGKAIL